MAMRLQRINFGLWLAAGAMIINAALTLRWAASPIILSRTQDRANGNGMNQSRNLAERVISAQDWQRISQLNLRQALRDPPPAAPPAAPPAPAIAPLAIQLAGTVCEPGHSLAILQLPDGTVQLKSVGDVVADARVLDIQQRYVTVEYQGKTVRIDAVKQPEN